MTVPHRLLLVVYPPPGHGDSASPQIIEADPDAPQLSVLDVSATRGDGIFETLSLGAGRPQALDAHMQRFARSARMLDLPLGDVDVWVDAVHRIAEHFVDVDEAWVKIVLSRGIDGHGDSAPTGWVYAAVSPDFRHEREVGLDVVLLDRGYRSDVAESSPWLLAGAKTLSYAVHRAAVREAQRRGADDALFVSSDGLLLEGPTSTLVVRRGDTLVTPPPSFGILEGTTQADLFAGAEQWGLSTAISPLVPDELLTADAAWLVSSVRHAAIIRSVDGTALPVDAALSAAMNGYLRARRD